MSPQAPHPDNLRERLGPWIDGELSPQDAAEVEIAVRMDPALAAEAEELRALMGRIARIPPLPLRVPPWSQLESKLEQPVNTAPRTGTSVIGWIRRHSRLVAAACIGLVLIGVLSVGLIERNSYAGTVDFEPLLKAQDSTLDTSLTNFLISVGAEPVDVPPAALLRFDPLGPQTQDRRLVKTYRFMVADKPAFCFVYQDSGPGMVIIQCPPDIKKLHGKYHCDHAYAMGSHREHMVEMGTWRLAHLERPGFCVCVFSTLHPKTELPVLVSALNVR